MTRPPLDLEAIRQRVEAATPGPWELIGGGEFVTGADVLVAPDDGGVTADNAIFIAHAREDVPALLAEVERLRDGIAELVEDFLSDIDWSSGRNNYGDNGAYQSCANRLQALVKTTDEATS